MTAGGSPARGPSKMMGTVTPFRVGMVTTSSAGLPAAAGAASVAGGEQGPEQKAPDIPRHGESHFGASMVMSRLPRSPMVAVTPSPGLRKMPLGAPTPAGVPVAITSPGISVSCWLK